MQNKSVGTVKKYITAGLLLILVAVVCLSGCSVGYEDYSAAGTVMGTIVQAGYRAEGFGNGEGVWLETQEIGSELEYAILSRKVETSEVAALNASAGSKEGFVLSEELEKYLLICLEVSKATNGAFDITLGALTTLWNIDEAALSPEVFEVPSEEAIEQALSVCGYDKLVISEHRAYMPQGMVIDMGAVGKGIYLSQIHDAWQKSVDYGYVAAGGSILTYGYKPGGDEWKVGIADPFGGNSVVATLKLEGTYYVSTSGDYERFVEVDGVRYHHIIDNSTGYPAESGIRSVTAVIDGKKAWKSFNDIPGVTEEDSKLISGLMSDAITTAIFVLGEEAGLELADEYEVDVLLVRNDGTIVKSDGMQGYID